MKPRLISIFIAIISVLTATASPAQQRVKIHGTVTDENNEPLEFVSISIAGTAIGAMSGLDGKYTLTIAPADTVRVVFSCIGYQDSRRRLISPKGDVTVNVKMEPLSYMLQAIEVTDIQRQTGTMQRIESTPQHLVPSASGSGVESIIGTMAGVASGNEMSSQYNVRGGTYDENLVYINGIEVYRPQLVSSGQQEGLSIINPDLVGSVNFSTGGFTARYGDKMSSVLDIQYRQPEALEGAVSMSMMGGSVALGTSSKRFSQLHGIRYKSNASLLSSMEDKGEYDPRFFDYQTNMNYRFNNRFNIGFLGNIAVNNYLFIPHNRTTNFGTATDAKQFKVYFDGQEKDRFETWFGAMTANYRVSNSHEFGLLASAFHTNELVSYDISGEYWLDQAGTSGGATSGAVGGELGVGRYHEHARNRLKASVIQLSLRGTSSLNHHTLNYGTGINFEHINDRSREWEMRDSAGYSLPADPSALKVIYNLDSRHDLTSARWNAYAEDSYRLSTAAGYLSINGGMRLSYWNYNKEFLASPRINFGFVPDKAPKWSFRFATGLYYQSPFYKEFRQQVADDAGNTVVVLNPDIKSPASLQFIGAADYTFRSLNRPFKLSGEAYYKAMWDLIPFEVDNLKLTYSGQNLTSGYAMGVDFKLFGQFVPGSDSWISFSLMKTNERLNGVNVPRPTDRRYAFALFFTDYFPNLPKLKFSLRGLFNDGLPTTAPRHGRDESYFRAPSYKRIDIGLSYGIVSEGDKDRPTTGFLSNFKSVWLGLDVFNLFDISNVSSYYWVTDVNGIQYAVPNYLTRRQLNLRLSFTF